MENYKGAVRYWMYVGEWGVARIHRSDCGQCVDGKGPFQRAPHIGRDWYGFYPTRGTAIDAATATGYNIDEHLCVNWDMPTE